MSLTRAVLLLFFLHVADLSEPPCIIELECAECVPDNMPLVTSHRAANGSVAVPAGGALTLACVGGKFLQYPLHAELTAVCRAGRYAVRHDGALRHILELGCQESVFEDVLHQVEACAPPLQGRAYRVGGAGGARHLATLCYDADRALPVRLRASSAAAGVPLPPHAEPSAPLSLLGNFNHMFDASTRRDAERLFSDDVRLNRRLRELLKHDRYCLAGQTLTSAKLLSGRYFDDQDMRVSEFASNRVLSWRSVVEGNLRHLHGDVAALVRARRGMARLDVYAGTHGALGVRAGGGRRPVRLRAGRFPVPRYLWTVLHVPAEGRALALVLLNEPLVAVSDIREAVLCESVCGAAKWLTRLTRDRNYERPAAGLVFCCSLPDFAERVPEMPKIFNATVRPLL